LTGMAVSASGLLRLWERSGTQPRVQQALMLLAAACPDAPTDDLARMSVGRRDGLLLELREHLFGSRLESLASCPACGERLQLAFNVSDVCVKTGESLAEPQRIQVDDYEVGFRLPDSNDQAAMAMSGNIEEGRRLLLSRCLLEVKRYGEAQPIDLVPESVLLAVSKQMAEADPQADVQLDLSCPACGHVWSSAFDIVSYLWQEIDSWARRTLRDIHNLAAAYGWREVDILNMSARRRQCYLEMIGGRG